MRLYFASFIPPLVRLIGLLPKLAFDKSKLNHACFVFSAIYRNNRFILKNEHCSSSLVTMLNRKVVSISIKYLSRKFSEHSFPFMSGHPLGKSVLKWCEHVGQWFPDGNIMRITMKFQRRESSNTIMYFYLFFIGGQSSIKRRRIIAGSVFSSGHTRKPAGLYIFPLFSPTKSLTFQPRCAHHTI